MRQYGRDLGGRRASASVGAVLYDPLQWERRTSSVMPIRYMGTKRHIASRVRALVSDLRPKGQVLDLFSGMGSVAEELAGLRPVVTNDALAFTAPLARARFTADRRHWTAAHVINTLRAPYRDQAEGLSTTYRARLIEEQRALDSGPAALSTYMAESDHVASGRAAEQQAARAAGAQDADRYMLTTLYFAAGYFGLRQAIHLDALRCAIDQSEVAGFDRDWVVGAWLATAAVLANAPGHTAQFLRPNTETAYKRIRRSWHRSVWDVFQDRLLGIKLVGSPAWRRRNRVEVSDALELLVGGSLDGVGAVYADPPYTRDQYSRFYHVYETLYLYDFPDSVGQGRVRSDRHSSSFCLRSGVVSAFDQMFEAIAELGVPLVLSYPTEGLLACAGSSVATLLQDRMTIAVHESFQIDHSTMGGSKGSTTKSATENLYVCIPAA
jgi:adenine-specific DNA-methyltransferase